MSKKNPVYERLEDQSETLDRIDTQEIEEGLGFRVDPTLQAGHGSPFSLWTLRSRLMTDLVSTGGRPGRREAISRKKIPLTENEWRLLDEITALIKARGINATPGQVAGLLLSQSMAEVLLRLDRVTPLRPVDKASAKDLTDGELEETMEGILAAAASAEVHLEQLRPVALELLRRMQAGKGAEADDEE